MMTEKWKEVTAAADVLDRDLEEGIVKGVQAETGLATAITKEIVTISQKEEETDRHPEDFKEENPKVRAFKDKDSDNTQSIYLYIQISKLNHEANLHYRAP